MVQPFPQDLLPRKYCLEDLVQRAVAGCSDPGPCARYDETASCGRAEADHRRSAHAVSAFWYWICRYTVTSSCTCCWCYLCLQIHPTPPPSVDGSHSVVLVSHGQMRSLDPHSVGQWKAWGDLYKISVLLHNYPGYGNTPGPVTVAMIMEDLDALVGYLKKEWNEDQISILGNSIGTHRKPKSTHIQQLTKDRVWTINLSRCPGRLSFQKSCSHITLYQLLCVRRMVILAS